MKIQKLFLNLVFPTLLFLISCEGNDSDIPVQTDAIDDISAEKFYDAFGFVSPIIKGEIFTESRSNNFTTSSGLDFASNNESDFRLNMVTFEGVNYSLPYLACSEWTNYYGNDIIVVIASNKSDLSNNQALNYLLLTFREVNSGGYELGRPYFITHSRNGLSAVKYTTFNFNMDMVSETISFEGAFEKSECIYKKLVYNIGHPTVLECQEVDNNIYGSGIVKTCPDIAF